ncbi:uncharacterized protein LOC116351768 [Contarinia nasturtii]|uniref:uncharacterized protein LOC116351768 n=1 Tax=Contarinia nasturtii TaxID=265458 RepID=UPI0012D430DC|nr:uncharacterized protein LOC116351768 [Contarinia nasturtii]
MAKEKVFVLFFIGIIIFDLQITSVYSKPGDKKATTASTVRNRKTTASSSTTRTTSGSTGNVGNRKLKAVSTTAHNDQLSNHSRISVGFGDDDSGSSICGCCRKSNTNSAYPHPYGPAAPISTAPSTQSGDKLAGMVGFARVAGVTGGWGGEVVQINTLQDLIQNVGDGYPRVLMINSDIKASSLTKVQMGSSKSIVSTNGAMLYNIYLRATPSSSNIIFQNLAFEHSPNNKGNDDIQLYLNYGTGYWIDHCSFVGHKWSPDDRSQDKLLYIGQEASLATISSCYFGNHRYGLIFGHPGDDDNVVADGNTRVTIYKNHFENLDVRAPGLFRYGHYHVFNNYIENYGLGFTVAMNGDVVSEYNYFGSSTTKNGMLDDKGNGAFIDTGSYPPITNIISPRVSWNPASIYSYQPVTNANPGMIKYQRKSITSAGFQSPIIPPPMQHMISPPIFPSLP